MIAIWHRAQEILNGTFENFIIWMVLYMLFIRIEQSQLENTTKKIFQIVFIILLIKYVDNLLAWCLLYVIYMCKIKHTSVGQAFVKLFQVAFGSLLIGAILIRLLFEIFRYLKKLFRKILKATLNSIETRSFTCVQLILKELFQMISCVPNELTAFWSRTKPKLPKWWQNLEIVDLLSTSSSSASTSQNSLCCICLEANSNVVLLPCNHLCMCSACLQRSRTDSNYTLDTCPICRQYIRSRLTVFT
jgi:hypothetical protein